MYIHGKENSTINKERSIKTMAKWRIRDNIAKNNDIAFGSVSHIIQEVKNKEIPDIDLLREVAFALKGEGLGLIQFARSMRLNKMLHNLEMSEEQIENFLEHLSVFFYKNDVGDVKIFLMQLESVSDMAKNLDLSIYDIREYVIDKRAELDTLNKELLLIKKQVEQEKSEFITTVKNTEKYRAARRYGG